MNKTHFSVTQKKIKCIEEGVVMHKQSTITLIQVRANSRD